MTSIFFFSFGAYGQHLTISTSGQTGTSGTNWSITGNTLNVAISGSATIHPSVITNHLTNTGSLTINLPWQNGTTRDVYINNSIAYTGNNARTLTINAANDLIVASGVSITSSSTSLNVVLRSAIVSGTPDHGRIQLNGATITTNGGHFWAGGGLGNITWNGLTVGNNFSMTWADDVSGISFTGANVTTNGGNVYMAGLSYNTSDADGENYGINFRNSSIISGAGQIDLLGDVKGMYTTGSGLGIFGNSGTVNISSTTGAINLTGTGVDQSGTATGWRRGVLLYTLATTGISITSVSGNITISGSAAFPTNGNDDMMGLQLGSTQAIADGVKITSQTGNIKLTGSNTRESAGQYSNALQFIAANFSNSIRIGYDGTNAYSGNITIEGNSILQNEVNAGAGSIAIQSTGALTIQPAGNAFTFLRAGSASTLTFDDDWNFGTTLSGFTFGKSTNNLDLTYNRPLTVAGPITFHAGNFTCNENITSSTASNVTINASGNFNTDNATRQTISSNNGNISIIADSDANGSGILDLDYLTLNPGTGNIIVRGETFSWNTSSSTDKPYLNGTGTITIEPSDAAFGQSLQTNWFFFDQDNNGASGVTIGKSTNTSGITLDHANGMSIAGPISVNGGSIAISQNISTTNNGDITLDAETGAQLTYNGSGISLATSKSITASGTGNISLIGRGGDNNAGSQFGIELGAGSSITTPGTGNITLNGTGGNGGTFKNYGVRFTAGTNINISSEGGNISITGVGNGVVGSSDNDGINIQSATINAKSGTITIDGGVDHTGSNSESITFENVITIGGVGQTGNITLRGNDMWSRNVGAKSIQTTGTLTVEPSSNTFSSALSFPFENFSLNSITGLTIGNLTNSSTINITSATAAAGPITLYGGTLSLTGNITSSNGSAISLYGNSLSIAGVLSSTGNLLIAGQTTSTPIGVAGGPGNLLIPSSYFATNFSNSLSGITIGSDNQTGAITAGTFTVTAPTAFKSTALTIAGPITLGNFDLTIDSRIAAVGGITSTTYFRTNGIGKIKRTINQNGSFRFPVGVTLTVNNMPLPVYLPITLTNKDVSREYYVSVSNGVYTNGGAAGTTSGTLVSNPDPRIDMTWNIGNSIGSVSAPGVDIVVNWPTAASAIFAGTSSLTTPTLLHHNGTQWGSIAGTTTYTLSTGTLTHTGYVGSFSPFAIAQSSGALPVTWLAFTASRNGEAVDLNWSTGSEINTRDFEIQHSLNTLDWTVLGTMAAAGNSQTTRTYRYTHGNPLKGNAYNYYRIKQRDLDGQFSISKIVSLLFGQPGPEIQVYPNPAFNMINVYFAEAQTIRLVNMAGATVWQGWMNAGRNTIAVDHLSKGIYTLTTNKGPLRILIQ